VTQQLRLVDPPRAATPRARANTPRSARPTRTATARTARSAPHARRAVSWGEWTLDSRTRRVGRAGVAAARRALADTAHVQALESERKAS
jgi:hypothetical protein